MCLVLLLLEGRGGGGRRLTGWEGGRHVGAIRGDTLKGSPGHKKKTNPPPPPKKIKKNQKRKSCTKKSPPEPPR